MSLGFLHILGILFTLALIIGVGIYSGTRVRGGNDFSNGGRSAGSAIVVGAILGALVGGQSTIGTSQLGFLFGLSAWWFTLGSGIGCLILLLVYSDPMRRTGKTTLLSIISHEYGPVSEYLGSSLSSIGIIVSIISNIVSGCALMMTILHVSVVTAVTITLVLMIIYVIFGGVWGAGMGGVLKLSLLYAMSIFGLILVLLAAGGPTGLLRQLEGTLLGTPLGNLYQTSTLPELRHRYLWILARGASRDLGSGASLTLGVLSTQTYAQAIWSARDNATAKKGALLSALLAPPIGLACLSIGIFMRSHCITAAEVEELTRLGQTIPEGKILLESTSQVLPAFILNYMHPLAGGMALGTLLITVVGGGAGLALGVSVILVENILVPLLRRPLDSRQMLIVTRAAIVLVLGSSAVAAVLCSNAMITDMGFLSMGLRGSVVFLPFTLALFLPGRIRPRAVVISMILGPIAVILGKLLALPVDPLFLGLGVNMLCCAAGFRRCQQER